MANVSILLRIPPMRTIAEVAILLSPLDSANLRRSVVVESANAISLAITFSAAVFAWIVAFRRTASAVPPVRLQMGRSALNRLGAAPAVRLETLQRRCTNAMVHATTPSPTMCTAVLRRRLPPALIAPLSPSVLAVVVLATALRVRWSVPAFPLALPD
jgi:hypothetical protein